jgi:hypothetical protein
MAGQAHGRRAACRLEQARGLTGRWPFTRAFAGADAISPTAHYTSHVWVRNGLSHPELDTWEGRVLFGTLG